MNSVMHALKFLIEANTNEGKPPLDQLAQLIKALDNAKKVFAEYNTDDVCWCNSCKTEVRHNDNEQDHINAGCDLSSYHDYRSYKCGINAIKLLEDITNGSFVMPVADGMLDQAIRTHRHLQSEIILVLSQFITKYGDLDPAEHADGRNAHMIATAKRMGEAV